ncbi:FGGY carbohydrate kinase domain-containing protein-like [Lineus longissimus]|uniref:FGGY carbohydrate kinase domain-containing protein-like n=1 Tax=Lineus longissimus TaxID=88925 RepID=UPI002B4F8768
MSLLEEHYFIGVDVGSGSVRAALVTSGGHVKNVSSHPLQIWNPRPKFYEQSSDNVWNACCMVVQTVTQDVDKDLVKGIGFDATCSLVVLDKDFKPTTVSLTGNDEQNVIMWMDHRAQDQADRINATKHDVLKYVGGKVSLEMDMPKILWLKESMKSRCWDVASHFLTLSDFMTWKATGSLSRSLCALTCKFNYQSSPGKTGWNKDYLRRIGLEELIQDNFSKIGNTVLSSGQPCGSGLSQKAAQELGLNPGTCVGAGILDAHAGAIGCLGCNVPDLDIPLTSKLAMTCGTSTCHMILSKEMRFVQGVWGPLYGAVAPGLWLHEAGQSAAGKLIDHVIEMHPAYTDLKERAKSRGAHIHSELNEILEKLSQKQGLSNRGQLTADLHMWPDFHGNRSPVADSSLKGMLCGLTLNATKESLALIYLATVQALAYGTRHILDVMKTSGYEDIQAVCACGGLSKNSLYIRMHADIVGLPFILPQESESVLLGSAILGAIAASHIPTIEDAMKSMCGNGEMVKPDMTVQEFHNKKYKVFLKMLSDQQSYQQIME